LGRSRKLATTANMRIENEVKLDFKDVLIRPKRSTLKSRQQVVLERQFDFRNSKHSLTCVPIIAANMDPVASFDMAQALATHQMLTAVHKHYTVDEWKAFASKNGDVLKYVAASSGSSDEDFAKLSKIMEETKIQTICLDVANGYSEHFVNFVRKVREKYPGNTIMAGNVVTGEMVEELVLSGADIVKVSATRNFLLLSSARMPHMDCRRISFPMVAAPIQVTLPRPLEVVRTSS